jgi:hypothetical protein
MARPYKAVTLSAEEVQSFFDIVDDLGVKNVKLELWVEDMKDVIERSEK